jgi:Xaa-Pro aminopeptidase
MFMKHLPIDSSLFINNRKRFTETLKPASIAIFNSNDEVPSNGDALYPFKQNSDLYWLTGIEQEDTMLVLFPGNPDPRFREVLVLVRPNENMEKWIGKRLRKEQATAISGIQKIIWLDSFDALLQQWIHLADIIYLNTNENDRKDTSIQTRDYRYALKLREQFPLHQYERSAKILKRLRAIKTKEEIDVVKQAIDITHKTFNRVMQFVKPGVMEYEVEAEIFHEFLRNRAKGEAYGSIIASGDNARTLHYVENNAECRDGDLLLMDFGANYGGYCADLTRTIPVSGKFTERQKVVYNACLQLHNYAKSILKPGITLKEYTDLVGDEATKVFVEIGLLTTEEAAKDNRDELETRPFRKYLYHGISHHLGVDVHDVGTRTEPIEAGMLFTIEPGIYIEEEKMGIRIENNVWITSDGNLDLFEGIAITAEEIEAGMSK